jgi:hypothetical protein
MSRSLMRHTIAELEQLFDVLKTDPKTLKALEEELQHRQVPRAVALLAKVRETLKTLKGAKPNSSPHTVRDPIIVPVVKDLNQQPDLWSGQSTPALQIAPKQVVAQPNVLRPTDLPGLSSVEASAYARNADKLRDDTHGISVDEAYKILRATAYSTWEAIEQTRRQAVQQAHPERIATLSPELRAQVKSEAKRANAAYAVLCQLRSRNVG